MAMMPNPAPPIPWDGYIPSGGKMPTEMREIVDKLLSGELSPYDEIPPSAIEEKPKYPHVVTCINNRDERFEKRFASPYLMEKFINKCRKSKKITITSSFSE